MARQRQASHNQPHGALEHMRANVPLIRTAGTMLSIIFSAGWVTWQVSQAAAQIDRRFETLDTNVRTIAESVKELSADKVSRKDLEIFCAKAQLRNKSWVCPFEQARG